MNMMDYNNPNDPWMHTGYDPYKGMNDDDRMLAGCLQAAGVIGGIVIAFLLCLLFSGCTTTQYVPVIEHKTDTLIQTKVQKDSIWLHDSIHVTEKGDTVRIEKWHTKYVEKQVHDTLYQSKTDSIPVPYEVVKEVPRKRTTIDWVLTITGLLAIIAVIIWVVNKVKRFLPGM